MSELKRAITVNISIVSQKPFSTSQSTSPIRLGFYEPERPETSGNDIKARQ